MTEHTMMTAQELAEARKRWVVRGLYYPAVCEKCGYTGSSEGFIGYEDNIQCPKCYSDRVEEVPEDSYPAPRLLATIEAKDAVLAEIGKSHADTCDLAAKLSDERDEALATVDALTQRAERAEALLESRDRQLRIKHEVMTEALALADARGRALEKHGGHNKDCALGWKWKAEGNTCDCGFDTALALTAPEALRQQQEREAEKDALIERLRAAARHDDDCFIDGDFRNGERIPGRCTCWLAALDSTKGGQ